ncbi:MAG TPA: YXWGXW repeat-containing protein [Terriglobia bacterium]|nr:YXWGXW repeat-containing protein [Terriglobia bacterium]
MAKLMSKKFYLLIFGVLLTAGLANAQVVIRIGPPAPVHERIGVRPGPGYVWRPGWHEWRGGAYVWVPGTWVLPPRPRARWIPAHYRRVRGGWVFVPGHWR